MDPTEHLFRHEAGRIIATLTRIFGTHNLALAEDVVQDAFCRALEVWKIRGVPENPSAWLMATARNRAIDALRRERTARTFEPELSQIIQSEWTLTPGIQELFAENAIKDDLLRMMFSCCHPRLSEEAQIALMLNILCGFSVGEVAGAFVSTQSAIEKRISRAKRVLASSKKLFDVSAGGEFSRRLPAVQRALYLLFNEGYHGASSESAIRADLCREAMRLASVLLEHPLGATPVTYALAALMHFDAARLPARTDSAGNLTMLYEQDRSQWDSQLITQGQRFLELSASGPELSEYHLEAAIAWVHATAVNAEDTNWAHVVWLYDKLIAIRPSPVVALSRAIAIGQHQGPARGLEEVLAVEDRERLATYPFYFAALGEFQFRSAQYDLARLQFGTALKLARNPMERNFLEGRMHACERASNLSPGPKVAARILAI